MQIIIDALVLGLSTAFIVLFISRFEIKPGTSIREWVQINGNKFISEMFHCDFCLSWWISLALGVVLSMFFGWQFLVAPIMATPIARYFE